ncbi:MAG: hypothetical protein IMZ61_05495 [Planctomycetes bacterium]|nr:hypothetical protein [Planctomycetota bacterium]
MDEEIIYLPPTLDVCMTLALEMLEGRLCSAVSSDPAGVLPLLDKIRWRPEANLQAVKFFKLCIDANIEKIAQYGEDEASEIIHRAIWDNDLFFDWAGWQLEFEPGVPWVKQAEKWLYKARALRAARLGLRVLEADQELLQMILGGKNARYIV